MAKAKNVVEFAAPVKHGKIEFAPTIAIRFLDPDAAPYFVKAGWATYSDKEPVMTYDQGQVDIDPDTVFNRSHLDVQDVVAGSES